MTNPIGPLWEGGFETVVTDDNGSKRTILYLADKANDALQREGKPPVYYWLPQSIRIARQNGDAGDYKFQFIHFLGVQGGDTTVGVAPGQEREVAGGVLAFTVTSKLPDSIIEAAHEQLLAKAASDSRPKWRWARGTGSRRPDFRPIPIKSNTVSITNLSPRAVGTVPSGAPPATAPAATPDAAATPPATASTTGDGLDPWYWNLQGQGPASVDVLAENAYSGLVGSYPAAILWSAFHGTSAPVVVAQNLQMKVFSQVARLRMRANWDRVFRHLSVHGKATGWWFDVDIKAALNGLRAAGVLEVEVELDGTVADAAKLREAIDKNIDLVTQLFMEQAKGIIFQPAPQVEAAKAGTNTFFGFGGGFALKYQRDSAHLDLAFDKKITEAYLQNTVISSTLQGFYDDIKGDPDAEKKYFSTVFLDDWDRKLTRIAKPVVNWPNPEKAWAGEPVAFMSVQVGYPATTGEIQWDGHVFQPSDGPDPQWVSRAAKKTLADVSPAPEGWAPDVMYVKRTIHFDEPPSETEDPYSRVFVEQNEVDLDPEAGTPTNDTSIEVRADAAGKLDVGPIGLGVSLADTPNAVVELSLQAHGTTTAGEERPVTKFTFKAADEDTPRYWSIFTGQPDYIPTYRYQVRVVVKGTLAAHGQEWIGPWVEAIGNGPLTATVPLIDDPGVTVVQQ